MGYRKIRIMFYSESSTFGGAEQYLYILIKGLDFSKYSVSLVSPGSEELKEFREKLGRIGVNIFTIEAIKNKFDFVNIIRQYRFFKRNPVDILHVNLPNPYHSQFSIIVARIAGIPSIVVTQHLPARLTEVAWRGKLLERLLEMFIDKVITVSESGKRVVLEKLPFSENKVVVIHNGINTEDIPDVSGKSIRKELNIDSKYYVICNIGRLTEQKGHIYFLEAANIIKRESRDVKFLIVGDGPLREELERYSLHLGLNKDVIFVGHRDNIYEILSEIDVFVLSSLYEGLPITILEAMYIQKPVVATGVNGIPEVVLDGKTGILVLPKDPESLAKAILSLLRNKKMTEEMGKEGLRRVREHFSSSIMVEKTEEVYKELFNKRRGRN